ATAAPQVSDVNSRRRPTICECFVDDFGGTPQRRELDIDYSQSAEKVREHLVATFGTVTSAEVLINDSWVQMGDVESFEAHCNALLTQEQVHWRLLVPQQEQARPASATNQRRGSPLRGRQLARTPSSPLRGRVSAKQERTPSRGRMARPATPP